MSVIGEGVSEQHMHVWWDNLIGAGVSFGNRRIDDIRAGFRDLGHQLIFLTPEGEAQRSALHLLNGTFRAAVAAADEAVPA